MTVPQCRRLQCKQPSPADRDQLSAHARTVLRGRPLGVTRIANLEPGRMLSTIGIVFALRDYAFQIVFAGYAEQGLTALFDVVAVKQPLA